MRSSTVQRIALALIVLTIAIAFIADGIRAQGGEFPLLSQWRDGICHAVAMSNSILYAQRGNAIDILLIEDLENPAPLLLGSISTEPTIKDLEIDGTILYIAYESGDLRVIDVSDPAAPEELANIHVTDDVLYKIIIADAVLYGKSDMNLWVYNVTNPQSPALLNSLTVVGKDIAIKGDALYIATATPILYIYDISDPSNIPLPDHELVPYPVDQVAIRSVLLVTGGGRDAVPGGFAVYSCANPLDLDLIHTIPANMLYKNNVSDDWLTVSGLYAYFPDPIDLGKIHSIELDSDYFTDFDTVPENGMYPLTLLSTDSNLFVTMYRGGYGIYDLSSNINDPDLDYLSDHGGYVYDIEIVGGIALLAQSIGLRIIDVSYLEPCAEDLSFIGPTESYDEYEYIDVAIDGDRAFCKLQDEGQNTLTNVYDISDPESPVTVMLDMAAGIAGGKIFAANDRYYFLNEANGEYFIQEHDVSDLPFNPTIALYSGTNFNGAITDFVVQDSVLCAADGTHGVLSFILWEDEGIELVDPECELSINSGVQALAVRGNKLLAGANNGDIHVISLLDPENMEIIGTTSLPDTVRALSWSWDTAYAVDASNTLYAIALLDPTEPSIARSFVLSDEIAGLDSEGYIAYLAYKNQGMEVLTDQTQQGIAWRNLGPGGGGNLRSIRIHPDETSRVIAGGDVDGIHLSLDGGDCWTTRNEAIINRHKGRSGYFVNEIFYHGATDVYVATTNGLYKSTDMGKTFEFIAPDDPDERIDIGECYISWANPMHQWATIGSPSTHDMDPVDGVNKVDYLLATTDGWQTYSQELLRDGTTPVYAVIYSIVMGEVDDPLLASSSAGLFQRDHTKNPVEWQLLDPIIYPIDPENPEAPFAPYGMREMVYIPGEGLYAIARSCPDGGCDGYDDWKGGVYKGLCWGELWEYQSGSEGETNHVINGDFESEDDPLPGEFVRGWIKMNGSEDYVERTSEHYKSPDHSIHVTSPPSLDCATQVVGFKSAVIEPVTPGAIYNARFYLMSHVPQMGPSNCYYICIKVIWLDSNGTPIPEKETHLRGFKDDSDCPPDMSWTLHESTMRAPLEAVKAQIKCFSGIPDVQFWVDDFELVKGYELPKFSTSSILGFPMEYKGLAYDDVDDYLYVGTLLGGASLSGVWRRAFTGNQWEYLTRKEKMRGRPYLWHQEHVWALDAQHPAGQNSVIYFSNGYLYKSIDGGATWDNMCWDSLGVSYYSPHGEIQPVWIHDVAENSDIPEHIYYGDLDHRLNTSYDRGETWHRIGGDYFNTGAPDWADDEGTIRVEGDAVTSIVMDPQHSNQMYCGVFVSYINKDGFPQYGGAVWGTYDSEDDTWDWSALGDQEHMPRGGPVDLAVYYNYGTRIVFAAVLGQGLYKLDETVGIWDELSDEEHAIFDNGVITRLFFKEVIYDEENYRLFALIGDAHGDDGKGTVGNDDGIWVTENNGGTFQHIFACTTEVFLTMALTADGDLLVATKPTGTATHNGKLYRLTESQDEWTASDPLLDEHYITSILTDDEDPDLIYVFASAALDGDNEEHHNGLWVSADGGGSWCHLPYNGISCLKEVTFKRSQHRPATFYAATKGTGLHIGQLIPPATPIDLTITDYASDHVDLNWGTSVAGIGYNIFRRSAEYGEWTLMASIGYDSLHTDTAANCSNTYYEYAVQAFNEAGSSLFSNTAGFTMPDDPIPAAANPSSGCKYGEDTVTVSGSGFIDGATVKFDASLSPNIISTTCTEIVCVTPPHDPGAVDITVTNPGPGGGTGILYSGFTYLDLDVTAVIPASGHKSGGDTVTVTGTGFADGAVVKFASSESPNILSITCTEIVCVTPPHNPGTVDVTVIIPGPLGGTDILYSGFTYYAGSKEDPEQ